MSQVFAPIILFIYKRPDHTRRVLEALHENLYANESTLYVFADGPKEDASAEDVNAINETLALVQEKQWCKEVILSKRDSNVNLTNNIIEGVTMVMHKHKKAIILEDDILPAPYFLKYCNEGLNMYESSKQVFSINAFMYDIDYGIEPTTFLCPLATNPWGWATWADRWSHFELNPEYVNEIENSVLLKNRFNFGNVNWFAMLKHLNTWYDRWYYSAFVRNGLGVFPTKPLVRNIGFDDTATNSGFSIPQQNLYLDPILFHFQSSINLKYYAKFLDFFKMEAPSKSQKLKNYIKKQINYKNYNVWWNESGQKLY